MELHLAEGQRLVQLAPELVEQMVPGQDPELQLAAVVDALWYGRRTAKTVQALHCC